MAELHRSLGSTSVIAMLERQSRHATAHDVCLPRYVAGSQEGSYQIVPAAELGHQQPTGPRKHRRHGNICFARAALVDVSRQQPAQWLFKQSADATPGNHEIALPSDVTAARAIDCCPGD